MLARFAFGKDVLEKLEKLITAVEEELDDDAESIITDARYQYIGGLVKDCVKKKKTGLSTCLLYTSTSRGAISRSARWRGIPNAGFLTRSEVRTI